MTDRPADDARPWGTTPNPAAVRDAFGDFVAVVARLRAPDGCPWDREQTLESIKPHTLEETYELLEAIDAGDDAAITEELGDVLLQVILDAQIGRDEGRFDILDVIQGVTAKIVRRHPHVFAEATADTADDVLSVWDAAKAAEPEKQARGSRLDGVPAALPSLARAVKLTKRAAKVGYDFPRREMLFDKLREELREFREELDPEGRMPDVPASVEGPVVADEPVEDPARRRRMQEELGDVLFVLANVARRWGLDPEEALRGTNAKFSRRFRAIEAGLAADGHDLQGATLDRMETYYQREKRAEKAAAEEATT